MKQETQTIGPIRNWGSGTYLTSKGLAALLALAGSGRRNAAELRAKTGLTAAGFDSLLTWLQREYLVDLVSTLQEDSLVETVELTERGEQVLVSLLEQMCELPEFR